MTQDRLKRLLEGLQGTDTFTLQNEVTVSPDVNNLKMATYTEAVSDIHKNQSNIQSDQPYTENNTYYNTQREQSDTSDFVKPVFLKDQDVHGLFKPPRSQWLTNVEIFRSIGANCKVPPQCIKGIQRIREMWRIYMDNEGDRLSLLVQWFNLRGRQVPLHSQNPHNPSTLQNDAIRIKGLFKERLRIDGKLTNCETGDRLVISNTLDKPVPRNLPIGKYIGRIFHSGQPEFENRNNNSEERICHKCLK
ncbi:unnamed protein product [Mytilus coruscus]|uniref:Uncharacterized protein n=1 Tax=Mytilus coruscus TaxID=42192 RepID=A0A6J8AHG9_MYTCO|nr:unnamed protein product [Mytilus coruscus]